jgi:type II secretory pathway component PulF
MKEGQKIHKCLKANENLILAKKLKQKGQTGLKLNRPENRSNGKEESVDC